MLRKAFIVIISLLFMSFSLSLTLAQQQQQQPPLLPLQVIYGTAKIDNIPLNYNDKDDVISIRMEKLLVIFMDSYEAQTVIENIIEDLEDGDTDSLAQEFLNSEYCSSQQIELSSGATVVGEPDGGADTEWRIRSGRDTFTVYSQQVDVWNGVSWVAGTKLEVYQHYGLMDSYRMGDLQTDNYALEVQNSPNNVFWSANPPYLLRDPGKAVVGDPLTEKFFIYINDVMVTEPPMPLALSSDGFVQIDINAPSVRNWSLDLDPGWSLISYGINECYYFGAENAPDQPDWVKKVDVASLGFNSLVEWVNFVIEPNVWKMIIGENGSMNSSLSSSYHSLKYFSPVESYWIRIDEGSGGATLSLQGQYYKPNIDTIPLENDWNYVSYPMMIGYYDTPDEPENVNLPDGVTWVPVPAPVSAYVFSDIAGKYSMVIGQEGTYNPALGPGYSSIHYIAPGQGFQIKMKQAEDLIYPSQ